jgi:hypothetical protein
MSKDKIDFVVYNSEVLDDTNDTNDTNNTNDINDINDIIILDSDDILVIESFILDISHIQDSYIISPKCHRLFNKTLQKMKSLPAFSYKNVGIDGYRTLSIYKNKIGIYYIESYMENLEFYAVLSTI